MIHIQPTIMFIHKLNDLIIILRTVSPEGINALEFNLCTIFFKVAFLTTEKGWSLTIIHLIKSLQKSCVKFFYYLLFIIIKSLHLFVYYLQIIYNDKNNKTITKKPKLTSRSPFST